jgi:NAD-dependent deacetylase
MSTETLQQSMQRAAMLLGSARHAVVFTGAGISTPSGIPDFRSQRTGMWERFDPMEVASIQSFRSRPERFYNWLRPLLRDIWKAKPNPAHLALARLESAGVIKAVITQNIDALHQRAGSSRVLEVHGSLRTLTCSACSKTLLSEQYQSQLEAAEEMPLCPGCQRVLKPDITLFGEMLPAQTWIEAEDHCRLADAILVVGSSLEVFPAAALPEIAVEHGAALLINNLSPTHLDSSANVLVPLNVAEAIPQIADLILGS